GRRDGAYDFTNEAGKTIAISLHGIGDSRFAGQAISGKDGNAGYAYTVFQVTNQEAVLYLPKCDEQDKAMIAAFNVEMIGQIECVIDRVRDPVQLLGRLSLGKPISKLVREYYRARERVGPPMLFSAALVVRPSDRRPDLDVAVPVDDRAHVP